MINNREAIEEILKTIKQSTKKPLTLKIRKMPEQSLIPIIKLAEKYCNAISIHPRTQIQGYSGIPDLEFARYVKQLIKKSNSNFPIIYSGNIETKEKAQNLLKEFDFIMLGRASIGNPSIFSDITEKKVKNNKKINFFDLLRLSKKINKNLYVSQIKFQAINFTKGFEGAPKVRLRLSLAKTESEIISIMNSLN